MRKIHITLDGRPPIIIESSTPLTKEERRRSVWEAVEVIAGLMYNDHDPLMIQMPPTQEYLLPKEATMPTTSPWMGDDY